MNLAAMWRDDEALIAAGRGQRRGSAAAAPSQRSDSDRPAKEVADRGVCVAARLFRRRQPRRVEQRRQNLKDGGEVAAPAVFEARSITTPPRPGSNFSASSPTG
jgi:hypothetical protein